MDATLPSEQHLIELMFDLTQARTSRSILEKLPPEILETTAYGALLGDISRMTYELQQYVDVKDNLLQVGCPKQVEKKRDRRYVFTEDQYKLLTMNFERNNQPSCSMRKNIAAETGLSFKQVTNYFNNKRRSRKILGKRKKDKDSIVILE